MAESLGRLRRAGAVLSLAVILAACGGGGESSDAADEKPTKQTNPTAVELAEAEGGTVSQFAGPKDGLGEYARYCRENQGTVTEISTTDETYGVTCQAGGVEYVLTPGNVDDGVLSDLCKQVGGQVVGVAVEKGSDFNAPACHIDSLG